MPGADGHARCACSAQRTGDTAAFVMGSRVTGGVARHPCDRTALCPSAAPAAGHLERQAELQLCCKQPIIRVRCEPRGPPAVDHLQKPCVQWMCGWRYRRLSQRTLRVPGHKQRQQSADNWGTKPHPTLDLTIQNLQLVCWLVWGPSHPSDCLLEDTRPSPLRVRMRIGGEISNSQE